MSVCPNCKKETEVENRFCPICGVKLWYAWKGGNLCRLFGNVEAGKNVHRLAQDKLWKIGKDLGFHSITDFAPPNTILRNRSELIDVVWKNENEVEFAFEIRAKGQELDIVTSNDDVNKLRLLSARKKFIVNVSNKTGRGYFNQITDEQKNTISEKPSELCRIRKKHPRAYASWSRDEDVEMIKSYKRGFSISQLARKHQRQKGAIRSQLKKLRVLESQNESKEKSVFTVLVKSEKYGGICLAGLEGTSIEDRHWVRPIKRGPFKTEELMMDNGRVLEIFDVVEIEFVAPYPIKHHTENMLFAEGTILKYVLRLGEGAERSLLSEVANTRLLEKVTSKEELYDELSNNLRQSLVLAGPVASFNIKVVGNRPRIGIGGQNNKKLDFVPCTDIKFCKFIRTNLSNFKKMDETFSSQEIDELKGKQIYFVIGLTGDHLDENNQIRDGKYAPPGSSIQPRYWPMIVSVLTVPTYSSED